MKNVCKYMQTTTKCLQRTLAILYKKKKKKKSQQNVLEEIKKKTFHYGTGYNSSENYKNCKYFYT